MIPLAVAGAAACIGWGFIEAKLYRVRQHRVPILPAGSTQVSILQVSDTHLRLENRRLIEFLRSLSSVEYDFVVATGDLLGSPASTEVVVELLCALQSRHGKYFVYGSSDYYAPEFHNYLDYFTGRRKQPTRRNPSLQFRNALTSAGWTDMNNRTIETEAGSLKVQITGLDDPHLRRDDRSLLKRSSHVDLAICLMHDPSPYLEADMAGYNLTICGHTHGGQVRLPLVGAVVTNSDVPTSMSSGLSQMRNGSLFVSPGLGTSRYAPVRFMCPPEASVLELVPKDQ